MLLHIYEFSSFMLCIMKKKMQQPAGSDQIFNNTRDIKLHDSFSRRIAAILPLHIFYEKWNALRTYKIDSNLEIAVFFFCESWGCDRSNRINLKKNILLSLFWFGMKCLVYLCLDLSLFSSVKINDPSM